MRGAAAVAALLSLAAACDDPPPAPSPRAAPRSKPAPAEQAASTKLVLEEFRSKAAGRVVAIGDVHGDLAATKKALKLAGAIGDSDEWVGGKLVVVQTGDQTDRGDDERAILDLFAKLERDASKAGGAFIVLNGNHETMNVMGDFRYVTRGGALGFESFAAEASGKAARYPESLRGRAVAFLPGGTYAKQLAARKLIYVVNDTLFAHGGVTPAHVRYGVKKINAESALWMNGGMERAPEQVAGEDAPTWTRRYSGASPDAGLCAELGKVLDDLGAKRLVVGHTVQKAINSACDGKVWRIDTGMAKHYGGTVQVLEIKPNSIEALE